MEKHVPVGDEVLVERVHAAHIIGGDGEVADADVVGEAVAAASDAHRAACEGEQEEDDERDPEACGAASAVSHRTSVIGTVMMDKE